MEQQTDPLVKIIERPVEYDQLGWREVATGISSGSWAIVLVFGILVAWLRKPLGLFLDKQLLLLDELRANLRQNSDTLRTMADTDNQSSKILEALQTRNEKIDTMIQTYRDANDKAHARTWEKLDRIEGKLDKH